MNDTALREHLAGALSWSDAHSSFDDAVRDLSPALRGSRPSGLTHSAWELLEHMRLAQRDILAFCTPGAYEEPAWPQQYWPGSPEPPSPDAWDESVAAFRRDREALQRLARDPSIALHSTTPHGTTQTYLRELLLVVDHTAYHVGQLVLVRQLLGAWPPP